MAVGYLDLLIVVVDQFVKFVGHLVVDVALLIVLVAKLLKVVGHLVVDVALLIAVVD